jgi:Flp pilus assembly protein TadG
MVSTRASEKGQIIVLFVIAIVVLFGFVGLAIDAGTVYAERRQSQNAADAAALSGASTIALEMENAHINDENFDCYNSSALQAFYDGLQEAIDMAEINSFTLDVDLTDFNGVQVFCGEEEHELYTEKYVDVTVNISSTTTTSFAQFLLPDGGMRSQVEAIARIEPRGPLAYGFAIVALNPADCSGHDNGVVIHGTADTYVLGSGVFSNGCLRGDGTPSLHVSEGEVGYGSEYIPGSATWDPEPEHKTDLIPPETYAIEEPDCDHPDAHHVNNLQGTLEPGLYCVNGDLMINGNDTVIGEGVTIYVPTGSVHFNGNATIQLSAPLSDPDPTPAIAGILIYLPETNTSEVSINGNAESWFIGTILAPGATVDIEGNAVIDAYKTQVIGWNVSVGGTADCGVTFQSNLVATKPTCIELHK